MSTLTGKNLNLVKPELTDNYKVTIGTDLPANFQKIDDEFSAHMADTVQDSNGAHGFNVESGTFTPVLAGYITPGINTYTLQNGYYRRQGNIVHCDINLQLSAKDAAMDGVVIITGLPFTAKSFGRIFAACIAQFNGISFTAGYSFFGANLWGTTAYLQLIQSGNNLKATALLPTNISNTTQIVLSIDYEI